MLQNTPQVCAKIQRQRHSLDMIVATLYAAKQPTGLRKKIQRQRHSLDMIFASLSLAKHPKGLRTVVLGGALANSKVWHF